MPWHDCLIEGRTTRINSYQLARRFERWHGWRPQLAPGSAVLMHLCDEPRCGNIDHIRVGTQSENNRQMAQRSQNAGLFSSGEEHWNAHLTSQQVHEVRELALTMTQREVAQRLDIHQSTVSRILSGKRRRSG